MTSFALQTAQGSITQAWLVLEFFVQTDGDELVLPLGHHTAVFQAAVYALLICA